MNPKSKTLHAALCSLGMMLALSVGARAAQDETAEGVPTPPDISEPGSEDGAGRSGEPTQTPPPPRVQRRQEYGQTITEYSRGGKVFLMTVKPRVGPTQYWDDPDGDGQFQRRTSDSIDETLNLPKWKLGDW